MDGQGTRVGASAHEPRAQSSRIIQALYHPNKAASLMFPPHSTRSQSANGSAENKKGVMSRFHCGSGSAVTRDSPSTASIVLPEFLLFSNESARPFSVDKYGGDGLDSSAHRSDRVVSVSFPPPSLSFTLGAHVRNMFPQLLALSLLSGFATGESVARAQQVG